MSLKHYAFNLKLLIKNW